MHLEKKKNTWYAVLPKPADVVPILGKKRWFKSTKTTDRATAQPRAMLLVAIWKAEIAKARRTLPSADNTFWESLRLDFVNAQAADDGGTQSMVVMDLISDAADKIADREAASRAYRVAIGKERIR